MLPLSRRGLVKGISLLGLPFLFGMNNPTASQAGCETPPISTGAFLGFIGMFDTHNAVYSSQR